MQGDSAPIRIKAVIEGGDVKKFVDDLGKNLIASLTPLADKMAKAFGTEFTRRMSTISAGFGRGADRMGQDLERRLLKPLDSAIQKMQEIERRMSRLGKLPNISNLAGSATARSGLSSDARAGERVASILRGARNRGSANAERADMLSRQSVYASQQSVFDRLRSENDASEKLGSVLRGVRNDATTAAENAETRRRAQVIADQTTQYEALARQAAQEVKDSERVGSLLRAAKNKGIAAAENAAASEELLAKSAAAQAQYESAMQGASASKLKGFSRATINQVFDPKTGQLVDSKSGTYTKAAGFFSNAQSLSVNNGIINAGAIEQGTSKLSQFWKSIAGEGPKSVQIFRAVGTAIGNVRGMLQGVVGGANSLTSAISQLTIAGYGLSRLGRALVDGAIDPLQYVANQTEQGRQFELSVGNVVGGKGAAKDLDDQLVSRSGRSGLSVDDLRDIARQIATTPALASRFAGQSSTQQADQVEKFGSLVNQLAVLDPVQGVQGSLIAIKEALSGDVRSLRSRLEINPSSLAALSGKTQLQLKNDPEEMIKALQRYTDTFIGRAAIDGRKNLISTQVQTTKDIIGQGAAKFVGDSGIYDDLVQRATAFNDMLRDYLSSAKFRSQAQRISDLLIGYVDGVTDLVSGFLEGLTGKADAADQISSVIDTVSNGFGRVVDFLRELPDVATEAGKGIHILLDGLAAFADNMLFLGRMIKELGVTSAIPGTEGREKFTFLQGLIGSTPTDRAAQAADLRQKLNDTYKAKAVGDMVDGWFPQIPKDAFGAPVEDEREGPDGVIRNNLVVRQEQVDAARARVLAQNGLPASQPIADEDVALTKWKIDQLNSGSSFAKMSNLLGPTRPGGAPYIFPGDTAVVHPHRTSGIPFLPPPTSYTPNYSAASAGLPYALSGLAQFDDLGTNAKEFEDVFRARDRLGNGAGAISSLGAEIAKAKGFSNFSSDDASAAVYAQYNSLAGAQSDLARQVEIGAASLPESARSQGLAAGYSTINETMTKLVDALNKVVGANGLGPNLPYLNVSGKSLGTFDRAYLATGQTQDAIAAAKRDAAAGGRQNDLSRYGAATDKLAAQKLALQGLIDSAATDPDKEKSLVAIANLKQQILDVDDALKNFAEQKRGLMQDILDRTLRAGNQKFADSSQLRGFGLSGNDLSRIDSARLGDAVNGSIHPAVARALREKDLRGANSALPGEITQSIAGVRAAQTNLAAITAAGGSQEEIEKATQSIRDQIGVVTQLRDQWQQTIDALAEYGLSNEQIQEQQRAGWFSFAGDVRGALESQIGQGLSDVVLKAGSFGDAMRSLGQSIVKMFIDMQVKSAFLSLFGNAGQTPSGGGGGLLGGGISAVLKGIGNGFASNGFQFSAPTTAPAANPGFISAGGSFSADAAGAGGLGSWSFAKGGAFPGSSIYPTGMQRFGAGGVVNRPQMAWIGESISNPNMSSPHGEAIMPLTRIGGQLGVKSAGGGQAKTTIENHVIVVGNHAEAVRVATTLAMKSTEGQAIIVDSLTGDVTRGGRSLKAIRSRMGR